MQEIKINPQLTWLSFNVEDLRNTSELATYGIDLETLQYAEDKNERPHTEFIPDSQDFGSTKKSINYSLSSRK